MCNIEIKTGGRCFGKTVDLKIQELKRLQKEIDDVIGWKNNDTTMQWQGKTIDYDYKVWKQCSDKIESNYAKIKQIIEEL